MHFVGAGRFASSLPAIYEAVFPFSGPVLTGGKCWLRGVTNPRQLQLFINYGTFYLCVLFRDECCSVELLRINACMCMGVPAAAMAGVVFMKVHEISTRSKCSKTRGNDVPGGRN